MTNPNKALWEKGDFTRIAAGMRESGEALVADIGITSGMRVLDIGCGDARPHCRRRSWVPTCSVSTSRATSLR